MVVHVGPRRAADWFTTHCSHCGNATDTREVLVCGGCQRTFHAQCVGFDTVPWAPFYCPECRYDYERASITDVTLDRPLMAYLFDGVIPYSPAILERCARTSRWLTVDSAMGDLVMV